ncbi:DNA-binding MarR family transcriptional regulator [Streptosporangium becharense]|uniref:DNA-binding MarR family transcriptional regulator n=1 Tax=Streptosporangium becharense TaxID=1816182 RepID=A0A7W9ME48_9ACTN|nr:MarR family transcriptional regulator [Streptosporangium becharense]MBB2914049.1 DNA-binding MarR family transcriptional regulator [Streptosporangium becharense]MBB5817076.1 DNA-binding MarR family transcriptional regulator [Streptosporangium becharense]
MANDLSRPTPSLLYAVKRLELAIRTHLDEMLRGSGVTTLQYTALTVLERRDGTTAAQLARDSFVTPQAMADMVRALDQRHLIRRSPNPDNKRELLLYLTEEGYALLDAYASAAAGLEDHMVSAFSPEQVDAFRTALTSAWITLSPERTRALTDSAC